MDKVVADTNALIAAVPAIYDALGATGVKPTALKPVGPLPPLVNVRRGQTPISNICHNFEADGEC